MENHYHVNVTNGLVAATSLTVTAGGPDVFQWVDNGDGTVSLLSMAPGQYVSANNANSTLTANAAAIGATEKFLG